MIINDFPTIARVQNEIKSSAESWLSCKKCSKRFGVAIVYHTIYLHKTLNVKATYRKTTNVVQLLLISTKTVCFWKFTLFLTTKQRHWTLNIANWPPPSIQTRPFKLDVIVCCRKTIVIFYSCYSSLLCRCPFTHNHKFFQSENVFFSCSNDSRFLYWKNEDKLPDFFTI